MKHVRIVFTAAACLLAAGCVQITPPDPALTAERYEPDRSRADAMLARAGPLSLERAAQIALLNNPDLTRAALNVEAARMRYYQAMGAYLPEITAAVVLTDGSQDWTTRTHPFADDAPHEHTFSTQTTIQATWLIFDGLIREFKLLAANRARLESAALRDNVRRLLLRAVAYAYYDIQLGMEKFRIYEADKAFQDANLEYARIRFRAGGANWNEVLNFQILAGVARSSAAAALYQSQSASYALAALLGYPEGCLPPHVEIPPLQDVENSYFPSEEFCVAEAVANRPDLRAVRERLVIAEYQKYMAMGEFLPTVRAFAGFGYTTQQSMFRNFTQNSQYLQGPSMEYGGTAQWTLFNGLRRYNTVREMRYAFAAAQYNLAQQYLTGVSDVRSAYANYRNWAEQKSIFSSMRAWVREQRELVELEYRAGHVVVTRLNEAQYDFVRVSAQYAIALLSLEKAKAQLEAAVFAPLFPGSPAGMLYETNEQ